eukprot:SAG11_NODE_469_length_9207_cov_5.391744_7_plen_83_part_00
MRCGLLRCGCYYPAVSALLVKPVQRMHNVAPAYLAMLPCFQCSHFLLVVGCRPLLQNFRSMRRRLVLTLDAFLRQDISAHGI